MMPFASFKNVQKRLSKIHKERSQPQRRHHLGILPKKQDFRLRAKDKESKSAKIKELRSKALDKNTDEFYFNMCNSRFDMEKGHIPLDVEKSYSDSDIKSSFYKNVTHLQYELQKEKSKIHQLESKTHLLQSESQNPCSRKTPKHIVFAETYGEVVELHHKYAEKVQVDETIFDKVSFSDPYFEDIYSQRFNAYKELSEHLERAKQLKYLLRQHEAKKSLMANLTKRAYKTVFKGSKTAPPVYEFEPVRDR